MFATSGSSVKFWDEKNFEILQDLNVNSGIIPAISWNKDGQILSSFNQHTSEVSLFTVDSKSAICSGIFRIPGSVTCLEFCKTNSRFLAIGDSKDQILIWDVKGNYKKKSYTVSKSCITNLSFSSSDSHLAVGTANGDAFTISNTNNLISSPIKVFVEKTEVKDIRYSILNRSIVGACGGNGNVALYDAITSKVLVRHNSHSAPASNIAFSPINELLMISVGYDKKVISYNVNTKSIVMKCETEDPLTCISFMPNGQSIGVGTMTGEVIAYDLRMLSHPLCKTMAYKGPVYDLKFQPGFPLGKLKFSKRRSKNIAANEVKDEPNFQDKSRPSKIKGESFLSDRTESLDSPSFEILSPVNSQVSQEEECPKFQNIPLSKNLKTPTRPTKPIKEYTDIGLLSPLNKENRSPFGKQLGSTKPILMEGLLSPLEGSPRSSASSSVKSSANGSAHKIVNSLEKMTPHIEGLLSPLEGSPRSSASSSVKSSVNGSAHKVVNSLEKMTPHIEDNVFTGLLSPMEGSSRSNVSPPVKSSTNDSVHKVIISSLEKASPSVVDNFPLSSMKNNSEQNKSCSREEIFSTSKPRSHEKFFSADRLALSADKVKKNLLKDLETESTSAVNNSSLPIKISVNTTEDEIFEEAVRLAFPHGDSEPPGFKERLGFDDSLGASLNVNVEVQNFVAEVIEKYDCRLKKYLIYREAFVMKEIIKVRDEITKIKGNCDLIEEQNFLIGKLLKEIEILKAENNKLQCIY